MRRLIALSCLLSLAAPSGLVLAQPAPAPKPASEASPEPTKAPAEAAPAASPAAEPAPPAAAEEKGDAADAQAEPRGLAPPDLAPIELPEAGADEEDPTLELPDPTQAAAQLEAAEPQQETGWTTPESVFRLHGYMRMRGSLLRRGSLGHGPSRLRQRYGTRSVGTTTAVVERDNYDPFQSFTPAGAGSNQVSTDLRLRLKPEIHLSDDIRVKAWVDVLDNVAAGSGGYGPNAPSNGDLIRVRRAWGEARNRDIGELRFGRMGADWGLGILDNGGDRMGIDSDFSSDVDRIMGITNLAGFYLMAAYDWASEGETRPGSATPSGVPIDSYQDDDLDVFTFAVAHRQTPEEQESALQRGEAVLNYGVYFVYRDQKRQDNPDTIVADGVVPQGSTDLFTDLNETQYVPDVWVQLLWEGLRVEAEAAFTAGTANRQCARLNSTGADINNGDGYVEQAGDGAGECRFRQFGLALEVEYRLFDDRLGLYFYSGLASGDSNSYGLASTNDPSYQRTANAGSSSTLTTYQFHPDYRVDMILWRTLMGRVAGAYYFKPGLSYDFVRDPYGQLAGGRLDIIYSRASAPDQTWGQNANLGAELNLSLYYRSEDGPDPMDGFYGSVQGGVLFPFSGLNLLGDEGTGSGGQEAQNALMLRGVVGVAY